mmetsp:Transcript_48004/g.147851  ORF Transcript_48004/g.147851 Transcript_48004/m.147851 type:complete len:219 (+) Transcript_48004:159-815(+)
MASIRRPAIPALLGSAAKAADTRHSGPKKLQKSSSRVREPIGGSAGAAAAGGFALPPGDEAADSSEATTESGEAGEAASAAAELKMATQSAALGLPLYRTAPSAAKATQNGTAEKPNSALATSFSSVLMKRWVRCSHSSSTSSAVCSNEPSPSERAHAAKATPGSFPLAASASSFVSASGQLPQRVCQKSSTSGRPARISASVLASPDSSSRRDCWDS